MLVEVCKPSDSCYHVDTLVHYSHCCCAQTAATSLANSKCTTAYIIQVYQCVGSGPALVVHGAFSNDTDRSVHALTKFCLDASYSAAYSRAELLVP
jgi:hypothetical protein